MKRTGASWLLVRFARGGETKARPSQLRALRSDEALTEKEKEELAKPFDPVRDVQDAVDADVRVATADGGFIGNVFIDRDGTGRRQFEAYALPGGGVGARCGICGLDQVLPKSAVADGGWKVVHALKSHCGNYTCSMSASNAHIAALQELVAKPLRRGMPGDAEGPAYRGAVEDGKRLWIVVKEAVVGDLVELVNYTTLEELGIELDDEDGEPLAGDTIVEFCIEQREYDDPRIKNVVLNYCLVGGKRKPLQTPLPTTSIGDEKKVVRGSMVNLGKRGSGNIDGTKEKVWLTGALGHSIPKVLRQLILDSKEEELKAAAEELVVVNSRRLVKRGCAVVKCTLPNVGGQVRADFFGVGPLALEKARKRAGRQFALNAVTHLNRMEERECFKKMSDDFKRDAIKALKNRRFDLEDGETTFRHLSSVTIATPPGTRVTVDAQGVEHWEYLHVSGEYRPAEDRADAEKKARKNPNVLADIERQEEFKLGFEALKKALNKEDDAPVVELPSCYKDADNRDGRGHVVPQLQILGDALWTASTRFQNAGFGETFCLGAIGELRAQRRLCIGNIDWYADDPDMIRDVDRYWSDAMAEESRTRTPALECFKRIATEERLHVRLMKRCGANVDTPVKVALLESEMDFGSIVHKLHTTRFTLVYAHKLVLEAGNMEPCVFTYYPASRYFYALATQNQMNYVMDATMRLNWAAYEASLYGTSTCATYRPNRLARAAGAGALLEDDDDDDDVVDDRHERCAQIEADLAVRSGAERDKYVADIYATLAKSALGLPAPPRQMSRKSASKGADGDDAPRPPPAKKRKAGKKRGGA